MLRIIKSNEQHTDIGKIYICSTPIGNLSDTSARLINTLKSVDIVACEDTRHTRKLLTHFDIHPPKLMSYHQHNEQSRQEWMMTAVQEGQNIALVSDAGTPLLSDPGAVLVDTAIQAGVPVIPVPGPSALLAALVGSGMPMQPFTYLGFLPRNAKAVREYLSPYLALAGTYVLYEAPHRLNQTLSLLEEVFGADVQAVLAKELTKQHETFVHGTLAELVTYSNETKAMGEYVILVQHPGRASEDEGSESDKWAQAVAYVESEVAQGKRHKEAVSEAVAKYGVQRRALYNETLSK